MKILITPMQAISVQANLQSKLSAKRGWSQNGQPVEYGEPLFVIG